MYKKMNNYDTPLLPLDIDLETKAVLKKVISANRYLAELKGKVESLPNEAIIINTLPLQEAKDSSQIENIITTQDELYKADLSELEHISPAAKEVSRYAFALQCGFEKVKKQGFLNINNIIDIQKEIKQNDAGIRTQSGTVIKNGTTGDIIHTPPQNYDEILKLMKNLEDFINNDEISDLDPLVKMAIIHLQFETIHPFHDGNGRTGRIINTLYLVLKGLLDIPVLYLSRYITRNKFDYYRLLQETRETGNWEEWILYILDGIEKTSIHTICIIEKIKNLMMEYKQRIRTDYPKIYSQDLLNNIFRHPYTKIEYIQRDLGVSRLTATKYLNLLTEAGILRKEKSGKYVYYVNTRLFALLSED